MIEEKYINIFKELKKERKRPKKKCQFCEKSYGNVRYHEIFCHKNPNGKRPEQCPYCGKYFRGLAQHKCKHNPMREYKSNNPSSHTIYISPDHISKLCLPNSSISECIREAIFHKLDRDDSLQQIKRPQPQSISLSREIHKQIKKHLDKNWDLSLSDFVRNAVIEELKEREKNG